jgi:cell division protease FtsH
MVTSWGMSERLGNVAIDDRSGNVFLGEQLVQTREYSEQTAREIDMEVRRLVDEAYTAAVDLIEENRNSLEILADALEQREVLDGKEVEELLSGAEVARQRQPVTV